MNSKINVHHPVKYSCPSIQSQITFMFNNKLYDLHRYISPEAPPVVRSLRPLFSHKLSLTQLQIHADNITNVKAQ